MNATEDSGTHPGGPAQHAQDSSAEAGYSAEVASQVGEATVQLAARLEDPGVAHTVSEIEQVTRGFSTTVHGMADALGGITEWLRANGHAGTLSGHASVVTDRLAHAGHELLRLAEAINQAEQHQANHSGTSPD